MKQAIPIHITRTKPNKKEREKSVEKEAKKVFIAERKEMSTQTEIIELKSDINNESPPVKKGRRFPSRRYRNFSASQIFSIKEEEEEHDTNK